MSAEWVLAIDPGPDDSGYCMWNGRFLDGFGSLPNGELRDMLAIRWPDLVVIEKVASYGMAVGESTFETCVQTGRFIECCDRKNLPVIRMPRRDVKLHICGSMKAKDANIMTALVDRFGDRAKHGALGKGTKKDPGFFFGFKSHTWAAFALAVTCWDAQNK